MRFFMFNSWFYSKNSKSVKMLFAKLQSKLTKILFQKRFFLLLFLFFPCISVAYVKIEESAKSVYIYVYVLLFLVQCPFLALQQTNWETFSFQVEKIPLVYASRCLGHCPEYFLKVASFWKTSIQSKNFGPTNNGSQKNLQESCIKRAMETDW